MDLSLLNVIAQKPAVEKAPSEHLVGSKHSVKEEQPVNREFQAILDDKKIKDLPDSFEEQQVNGGNNLPINEIIQPFNNALTINNVSHDSSIVIHADNQPLENLYLNSNINFQEANNNEIGQELIENSQHPEKQDIFNETQQIENVSDKYINIIPNDFDTQDQPLINLFGDKKTNPLLAPLPAKFSNDNNINNKPIISFDTINNINQITTIIDDAKNTVDKDSDNTANDFINQFFQVNNRESVSNNIVAASLDPDVFNNTIASPLVAEANSLEAGNVAEQNENNNISSETKLNPDITKQPKYYSKDDATNVTQSNIEAQKFGKSPYKDDNNDDLNNEMGGGSKSSQFQEILNNDLAGKANLSIASKNHSAYELQNNIQQVNELGENVKINIYKSVKENNKISIELHPHELGRLEIKIDTSGLGKTAINISAEKAETLSMLQKDARSLERILNDVGIKADASSLTFNLNHGQQQNHHNSNQLEHDFRFFKNSNNEDLIEPIIASYNGYYQPSTGLDITV
jgi:hypothetical protein